jgi:hypothetical protein
MFDAENIFVFFQSWTHYQKNPLVQLALDRMGGEF